MPDPFDPSLITDEDLRVWMDQHRTEQDDGVYDELELNSLIRTISAYMETWCRRVLKARSMTVMVPGTGSEAIDLTKAVWTDETQVKRGGCYPIQAVSSVIYTHRNAAAVELTDVTTLPGQQGYYRNLMGDYDGRIFLAGRTADRYDTWPVEGEFGFDPDANADELSNLARACLIWCSYAFHRRVPEEESVQVDGMNRTVRDVPCPTLARDILQRYRRW